MNKLNELFSKFKYEFGIFRQKFVDGWQTEMPDFWLPGGSVWLQKRDSSAVDVHFGGDVKECWYDNHHSVSVENTTVVRAVPYDLLVAGADGKSVNVLRLWSSETRAIDMAAFNQGDYVKALEHQAILIGLVGCASVRVIPNRDPGHLKTSQKSMFFTLCVEKNLLRKK